MTADDYTAWREALSSLPPDEADACAMDIWLHGTAFIRLDVDGTNHRVDPRDVGVIPEIAGT